MDLSKLTPQNKETLEAIKNQTSLGAQRNQFEQGKAEDHSSKSPELPMTKAEKATPYQQLAQQVGKELKQKGVEHSPEKQPAKQVQGQER